MMLMELEVYRNGLRQALNDKLCVLDVYLQRSKAFIQRRMPQRHKNILVVSIHCYGANIIIHYKRVGRVVAAI